MGPYEDGEGVRGVMIEDLLESDDVQGLGQEFLDRESPLLYTCTVRCGLNVGCAKELDRVPRKSLKKGMDCPICGNPFLDGKSLQGWSTITARD